ncbi:NRPS cluster protein [Microsporum audouinii]
MPFLTDENNVAIEGHSGGWDFDAGGEEDVYEQIATSRPGKDTGYMKRFRSAVENMVSSTAILRTWIVQCDGVGLLQAVLQEPIQWDQANSLEDHLEKAMMENWGIGDRLVRYTIINSENTPGWLVWTVHHALYDGWSFKMMAETVASMYLGCDIEKALQYKDFVKHIMKKNSNGDKAYWKSALAGNLDEKFPQLPTISYTPVVDAMVEQRCPPLPQVAGISRTALLQAAWVIVQSHFHDSNDPILGTIVSGRDEALPGIKELIGPTIAVVPIRVNVDIHGNEPVEAYLVRVQTQTTKRKHVDQLGLQGISRVNPGAKQACGFQTLLVVQPGDEGHVVTNILGVWRRVGNDVGRSSYAITIQCFLNRDYIRITAAFDASIQETWLVEKMLAHFSFVAQELAKTSMSHTVAQILAKIPPGNIDDIWGWNASIPASTEECVHNIVSAMVEKQPQSLAVCAWDGTLTYEQLDNTATQLTVCLIRQLGAGLKGQVIPLCFEKSIWMPVAMLGVMKAGGASVALDITLPTARLKTVIPSLADPKLIFASRESKQTAKGLGGNETIVIVVDGNQAPDLSAGAKTRLLPSADPSDALMVLFTSGSTGLPKGTIITHSSFATAINHHGKVFGVCPGERVYDFASYSFDIAWFNALQSLSHGACLCIPSEHERKNDLEGSILRFKVTVIFITPSVARLLKAHNLPCIKCVALGGEPQKWSGFQSWPPHVRKLSVYGPAECTVVSAASDADILQRCDMIIGHGLACANWVLANTRSPTLAPIGTPIRSLKPPTGFCVVIRRGSQADTAGHTGLETSCDTITVDWNLSLYDLLQKIQTQAADMIAFEQTGLQHIKQINQDTKRACQFQTLLMIQPIDIESSKSKLFSQEGENVEYPTDAIVNFSEYVLTLECQLEQQGMRILANFDSTVIDEVQMTRILQQLEHILRQLLSIDMQSKQLKQLHMLNAYNSSAIWQWDSLHPI